VFSLGANKEKRVKVVERFEADTQFERNKVIGAKLLTHFNLKYIPYDVYNIKLASHSGINI